MERDQLIKDINDMLIKLDNVKLHKAARIIFNLDFYKEKPFSLILKL